MYRPNFLFSTDSYKCSHHLLYPPETNYMFAYLESRVDSLFGDTDIAVPFAAHIMITS